MTICITEEYHRQVLKIKSVFGIMDWNRKERRHSYGSRKKQSGKDAMAVINEHIKNESYAPVYLLYGDETYLVNQYRDKLLSAVTDREDNMNFAKFAGEKIDPMEIIGFCETMPFFADRRVVLAEETGLFKRAVRNLRSGSKSCRILR